MKRILAAAALMAGGCVPDELRTLTIPTSKEIEVPGQGIGVSNPLVPDDVFPADAIGEALSQQMQESFATNDVDKDAVDSLKLTLLKATVLDPDENGTRVRDLGFLESGTFFVGAEGQEPVKVAESAEGAFDDPAPVEYAFELTDAELAPVLKASDQLTMTADVVPGERPRFATTVRFDVELTVLVNPVGALNGGP